MHVTPSTMEGMGSVACDSMEEMKPFQAQMSPMKSELHLCIHMGSIGEGSCAGCCGSELVGRGWDAAARAAGPLAHLHCLPARETVGSSSSLGWHCMSGSHAGGCARGDL